MKSISLAFTLLLSCYCYAQSLPFHFETDITDEDFVDFDGGTADWLINPDISDSNPSALVAQIIRDGGEVWSGSKVILDSNLDFSTETGISMKVWTSAPIGTVVQMKLEGNGSAERLVSTSVSEEWETLYWDFAGVPSDFNEIVFMFDLGDLGDGSEQSTFYFDDVEQIAGVDQLDLPVSFEDPNINYTVTPFEGNSAWLVNDPTDESNTVAASQKNPYAAPWAGVTVGIQSGLVSDIPLTSENSNISVRVWSEEAGIPVRLKVEDSNDPARFCETEINTTTAGEWEIMVFDFNDNAPNTPILIDGLNMGWTFDLVSVFFDFATEPSAAEPIYYFDDITFGILEEDPIDNINESSHDWQISAFPNPSNKEWNITGQGIDTVHLYSHDGQLVSSNEVRSNSITISNENLTSGVYYLRVISQNRTKTIRLTKSDGIE